MKEVFKHRAALLAQCPATPGRMPEAEAAKLPIQVTRWGTQGPTVLIVHGGVQGGIGGGPSTFSRQAPLQELGWQLVAVDRPGFGESPSRGVDDQEADAVWIAEMLGDGAHLLGHSWGGAEVLLAAARRPEAVRSLILIEPALQPLMMGNPYVEEHADIKANAMKMLELLMASNTPAAYALGFVRGLGPRSAEDSSPNTAAAALERNPERAAGLGCALLQARMASTEVMRSAATTVATAGVPVLVITGGWSPAFDAVGEIAARETGGRHVIVRAANHFVQSASADEFNRVVDAFMREAEQKRNS